MFCGLQAPLSMELSRQEYWCGLLFPPPEDLPNQGIEPVSSALAFRFFTTESPGNPASVMHMYISYLPPEKSVCRSRSNRTGHRTTDWFQIWKGICQGCILSHCLFNFYAEYIMRNGGLDASQAGIKIPRRNISNLKYIPPLWQKAKRN